MTVRSPHADVRRRDAVAEVGGAALAALFVALAVVISAAVFAGDPSGAEDCVAEICPH